MPDRAPVLFVDDEASMREAVTQWLELAGFDLVAHDNAASAIGHLSRDFRGPLVTDLKMEGMDGLPLLRPAGGGLAGPAGRAPRGGEPGPGRDLTAGCLHVLGRGKRGNYVAINWAAVPDTMVESEFLGHEAGAFTSGVKARAGKLEHA